MSFKNFIVIFILFTLPIVYQVANLKAQAVNCNTDADCTSTPSTPVCNTNIHICVQCLSNLNCTTWEKPICDTVRFICVQCRNDSDCNPATNINASGGRTKCDSFSDPQNPRCVQCLSDSDCDSGIACVNGVCCPATSPTKCGNVCCAASQCANPTTNTCCTDPNSPRCGATCCPTVDGKDQCARDLNATPSQGVCCVNSGPPLGNLRRCGNTCCVPAQCFATTNTCCADPDRPLCGSVCCPTNQCVNGTCCPNGQIKCTFNNTDFFCGTLCNSGVCCPLDSTCCGNSCCNIAQGYICSGTTCYPPPIIVVPPQPITLQNCGTTSACAVNGDCWINGQVGGQHGRCVLSSFGLFSTCTCQ